MRYSNFQEGDNLTTQIEEIMVSGKLKGVELFVFTESLVFENILYKGTPKNPLLFEIVLRLHQVHIIG